MRHVGINMEQVKMQNRSSILNYINEVGPVSRKDMSVAIGLTSAAVTQICSVLMEEGLLIERGTIVENTSVGRRKVLVDINYDYAYVFGINIEMEQTVIALSNLRGELKDKKIITTDTSVSPKKFLEKIAAISLKMRAQQPKEIVERILAVSVGIAGIVNKEKGTSVHAYGIWEEEVPVCDILGQILHLNVMIENNVNAFARACLLYGVGRQYDNLLIIKWGPGVGCTVIVDNKVYEGRHGKAAELGHFIVEKNGRKCNCGRKGCLETKVSYKALNRIITFERNEFGTVYKKSSAEVKEGLDEAIDLFARSIVNSVTILAPNRIVLCGYLFRDAVIRDKLISCCKSYDASIDEKRILYTLLKDKEDYIGPIAYYVGNEIF